jgi:hypothetical protein
MAAAASKDTFANYAIVSVVESAPNTLTFKKLETGISLTEKVAWVISKVEYFLGSLFASEFNSDTDGLKWGLSLSSSFSTPVFTEETIIDLNYLNRVDWGTAATGSLVHQPFSKDFSTLPGGGVLVPPTPLYLFAAGSGLVSANSVGARLHYTVKQMGVDEYWQLVEARRVLSS